MRSPATRETRLCVSSSQRRIVKRSNYSSARQMRVEQMRIDMKRVAIAVALIARSALGQNAADGPVLEASRVSPTASLNLYVPAGSVRLVAGGHDSIVVRGEKSKNDRIFFGGGPQGFKMGVESRSPGESEPSNLVVYMPHAGRVSVRTASANIVGEGVSGTFTSSSGNIRLSGVVSSV